MASQGRVQTTSLLLARAYFYDHAPSCMLRKCSAYYVIVYDPKLAGNIEVMFWGSHCGHHVSLVCFWNATEPYEVQDGGKKRESL